MKALITGASSGIGRDMAFLLSDRGYDLILVARREEKLIEIKNAVKTSVTVLPLDLSKADSCYALFEQTKDEKIDLLVNNAGFGLYGSFSETPLEKELELLRLNIEAVHSLTKLYLPLFKKRNSGTILNVASSAAFLPGPLLSAYYASKAYVLRLSQAINYELKREKSRVRVVTLCPGPVKTEFGSVAGVSFSLKGLSSRYVARYAIDKALKGKSVIVPGITMKLAHFLGKIMPDCLLLRSVYHLQRKKR